MGGRLPILVLAVRERLRATVGWMIGVALLMVVTQVSYPAVRDNPELVSFAEDLPEAVKILFGEDFVSPAGYLNSQVFLAVLPVLLLVFAIGRASATLAGEEQDGVLELWLAHPVSRTRLLAEKYAAITAGLVVLGAVTWVTLWLGAIPVDMDIGAVELLAGTVHVVVLALAFATIGFAAGAVTGSKGAATGVGAGVAAVSYVLYGLLPLVDLEGWRWVSLFDHAFGADPLATGFDGRGLAVLAAVTVVALGVARWGFERRDIGA